MYIKTTFSIYCPNIIFAPLLVGPNVSDVICPSKQHFGPEQDRNTMTGQVTIKCGADIYSLRIIPNYFGGLLDLAF